MDRTTKKIFQQVLSLPTAPFHEHIVADYIRSFAKQRELKIRTDRYGNLVVRYQNGRGVKPVALSGHMDHPGFEVLEGSGRSFGCQWLGACDPGHVPGSKVMVISGDQQIQGKVATVLKPDRTFKIETRAGLPVSEGAFGYWRLKPVVFDGDRILTKGADNLASCAAILAALDRLDRQKAEADLLGVFTRAEEVAAP